MSRTYVVTGAASGTGAATVAALRADGHRVFGVDLHNTDINADLSSPPGRLEAAEIAYERSGGNIDAIIACAGVAAPKPVSVAVNFFGATQFIEGLLDVLANSAAPRVAVISSVAALQSSDTQLVAAMLAGIESKALIRAQELYEQGPAAAALIYPSSKLALSYWVRRESVTPDFAGQGIALNAVGLGTVLTPMTETALQTQSGRSEIDAAVPMPLNYHLKPEDVAKTLMWLTSEENSHITGQTIFVDGGAEAKLRPIPSNVTNRSPLPL
jgi:NAD(P)-dependent dehydrogenase (short-subunit alcohol dehydrogenase family)